MESDNKKGEMGDVSGREKEEKYKIF